ncbi:MAG: hypothetical protein HFG54_14705 [Lachnospiraceae bacterium]|jgi:hypothetical protein|nr:hypothetical protein [Lachnospiraceae bacterium]
MSTNASRSGKWGGVVELIKAAFEHVYIIYNSWQGVYTSEFLFSIYPGLFNEKYYILTPLIFTIIPLVLGYASIRLMDKYLLKESKSFCLALTLFIVMFYLLWLPHPNEGYYWYSGAINYLPWFFLSIYNICLLIDLYQVSLKCDVSIRKYIIYTIASCFCGFLISGAHLSIAFENVLVMLLIEVFFLVKGKYKIAVIPLIVCIVCFYINISAPGTAVRRTNFTGEPLLKSVEMTLQRLYYCIFEYTTLHVVVFLIALTPIAVRITEKIKTIIKQWHIIASMVISFLLMCATIIMPYYSMGYWGDGRYVNLVWVNHIFFLSLNYIMIVIYLLQKDWFSGIKDIGRTVSGGKLTVFTCIALTIIVFIPKPDTFNNKYGFTSELGYSNSIKAVIEISNGSAAQYAKELDERIELYNDDSVEEVVVSYLTRKPYLLYFSDLTSDPTVFPNTSVIKYYGKKSVVAQ